MLVPKGDVELIYQRYARKYNFTIKFYRLIGLHIEGYRKQAIDLLDLKQGDCGLNLGCMK